MQTEGMQFQDIVATPAPIFRSKYGSLQMTTYDLAVQYQRPLLAQLEASDMCDQSCQICSAFLTSGMLHRLGRHCNDIPLKSTLKYPPNQVNILSARNMDPSVATTSVTGGLNIETPAGRKSFTVEEYISRCVQEGPSAVISMADETNHNTSKKRTRKAYDTTLSWFHKLASTSAIDWNKCFLFGTVTGMASSDEQYIRIMTEDMIRNGARGIAISGYGQGEARDSQLRTVSCIRKACLAAAEASSEGKPIPLLVQGVNDIEQIVEALALGIDYIATDLPYILTNAGYAFSRFDMTPLNSMEAGSKDGSPSKKRLRLDGDGSTSSNTDPFYINIRDRKFARDLRPLMVGCTCHSCRSHSRGYIHHLILAHELLGEVLINAHNQHNLLRLFDVARCHIKEGTIAQWADSFQDSTFA